MAGTCDHAKFGYSSLQIRRSCIIKLFLISVSFLLDCALIGSRFFHRCSSEMACACRTRVRFLECLIFLFTLFDLQRPFQYLIWSGDSVSNSSVSGNTALDISEMNKSRTHLPERPVAILLILQLKQFETFQKLS